MVDVVLVILFLLLLVRGWFRGFVREGMDLAGLVSPELLDLGRSMGFADMVASAAWLDVAVPDYLVDRTREQPRWEGVSVSGVQFIPLKECIIENLGLSDSSPWLVTLYRVQRSGSD